MVEHLSLKIDDLLLDEENPRIGSVRSQSEALAAIIELNPTYFRNMMRSIVESGLDPGDSLYVIESDDPDDFVVLEGNRRLSALKIMRSPSLLEGLDIPDGQKKSLRKAALGFRLKEVEPIRCVLFPDRDAADEWIIRRHTNSAGGEGRISWGPMEIRRFSGDKSLLDILDFVGRNSDFTPEQWEEMRQDIESRRSSTLSRLIVESPVGRSRLRLSFEDDEHGKKTPYIESDPKWVLAVLSRVIEDVRTGEIDSRKANKSSSISDYFENLPEELQPSEKNKGPKRLLKDIDLRKKTKVDPKAEERGKKGAGKKTKQAPKPRVTLAPRKATFKDPASEKGRLLLREAAHLDCDKYKISGAFLLRAFVELTLNEGMKKFQLPMREPNKQGKLQELTVTVKAERVCAHLTSKKLIEPSELRPFRSQLIQTGSASLQNLNSFMHNTSAIPLSDALRNAWDASVPLFEVVFGEVS